jgi:hypothetical protein
MIATGKVPETCGTCHKEIAKTYDASVHGEAVQAGVKDTPVCVECHGEHHGHCLAGWEDFRRPL